MLISSGGDSANAFQFYQATDFYLYDFTNFEHSEYKKIVRKVKEALKEFGLEKVNDTDPTIFSTERGRNE